MQSVVNCIPITTWATAVTHTHNEHNAYNNFETDYNHILFKIIILFDNYCLLCKDVIL